MFSGIEAERGVEYKEAPPEKRLRGSTPHAIAARCPCR